MQGDPKSNMTDVLMRRDSDTGTMAKWRQGQKSQRCSWKPRNTKEGWQTPEAGRKDSSLEPSGRARPCQHLDLGPVASRAGRR